MSLKIMSKIVFAQWVQNLCEHYRVVGPRSHHGQYIFDEVQRVEDLELDYPTSILSPKKYLLPPREELFQFQPDGTSEVTLETTPAVIIGVHTCDMHAIRLLDRIHETGYADQHYLARRENLYLISLECLKPCTPDSFCKSMGTLNVPDEYDLHLTDLGDSYAIDIGSEKGEKLLEDLAEADQPADEDYKRINRVMSEKWPRFSYRLDFDVTELPDLLTLSQNSDYWQTLGDRCLACGMCTKVCPTCYCFDVEDEVDLTLQSGKRMRVWDSCQIDTFAAVAGGHNFREERALRQRHRFLRKGKYQQEAYGLIGCVGCGRCATSCLVHITPVETFNDLYERHMHGQKTEIE